MMTSAACSSERIGEQQFIHHLAHGWGRITQLRPYVPQNISEILDHLADMLFTAPTFKDKSGFFHQQNIDTEFFALNEGLLAIRKKLGEDRYGTLRALSDKMRALFEADREDKTGDARAGRQLIREMEEILKSTPRPSK